MKISAVNLGIPKLYFVECSTGGEWSEASRFPRPFVSLKINFWQFNKKSWSFVTSLNILFWYMTTKKTTEKFDLWSQKSGLLDQTTHFCSFVLYKICTVWLNVLRLYMLLRRMYLRITQEKFLISQFFGIKRMVCCDLYGPHK